MNAGTTLLFVYGTLKRARSNHGWMSGQKFIGQAMTQPRYRLYDLGGYPGMIADETHGISIHGEVWEVDADCLARLDDLEDIAGGEYARELIPLMHPFDHQPIQGYCYLRELTDEPDCGACW